MYTAVLQQQAQVTRCARRLHIGNLPEGLTDKMLQEAVEIAMIQNGHVAAPGACVNSAALSSTTGKYAFVEFRSALETKGALAMGSIMIAGQTCRLNRSHEYTPIKPEFETLMIPAGLPHGGPDPLSTLAAAGIDGSCLAAAGVDLSLIHI